MCDARAHEATRSRRARRPVRYAAPRSGAIGDRTRRERRGDRRARHRRARKEPSIAGRLRKILPNGAVDWRPQGQGRLRRPRASRRQGVRLTQSLTSRLHPARHPARESRRSGTEVPAIRRRVPREPGSERAVAMDRPARAGSGARRRRRRRGPRLAHSHRRWSRRSATSPPVPRRTRARYLAVKAKDLSPSEAHVEMDRRRARTPRALAVELAQFYGHDFDQPLYIQAIALIAQIRLGYLDDVKRLVEPYVERHQGQPAATQLARARRPHSVHRARAQDRRRTLCADGEKGRRSRLRSGRPHEGVDAVSRRIQRFRLHGHGDCRAGRRAHGRSKVFRSGRTTRGLHAEARAASRWPLSPLTRNRSRVGPRQWFPRQSASR